jgi:hypothetical protein
MRVKAIGYLVLKSWISFIKLSTLFTVAVSYLPFGAAMGHIKVDNFPDNPPYRFGFPKTFPKHLSAFFNPYVPRGIVLYWFTKISILCFPCLSHRNLPGTWNIMAMSTSLWLSEFLSIYKLSIHSIL